MTTAFQKLIETLKKEAEKLRQETAMQCYLEVLAVGCGESEYSEAIKTKFNLVTE